MWTKYYRIFFLIAGLGLLGFMLYRIGLDIIVNNIAQIGFWFIPVLLSWFLVYLMNAFAFRHVLKNPDVEVRFSKILQLTVTGYSINYITPFVALGGEPYRIMELTPLVGKTKASSSVLLYGMLHVLSHILFWFVSIIVILAIADPDKFLYLSCAVILIMGVGICWFFLRVYKKGLTVSLFHYLKKVPFVGKSITRFTQDNQQTLADIDVQIKNLYDNRKRDFYMALMWEFFARVIGCAELFFIALALGMEMSIMQSIIVSSGSSLFANIVFFFPMQLGTREGGLVMALVSLGFAASLGVIMGLATRVREIVWIGIGLLWMNFVRK